jgi:hypothetical protein
MLGKGGKDIAANIMFDKGRHFIAAASLLNKEDGMPDVVLHCLGQGIECILKALLMNHDYDHYLKEKSNGKSIIKNTIGHDLAIALKEVAKCYKIKKINYKVQIEIAILNEQYKAHSLRYGMPINIFQDLTGFNFDLINRKLLQAMKIIEHYKIFTLK